MATAAAPAEGPAATDLFARLRAPQGRSHNHQPLDEILRQLRVGPVERLLLWLSKTDCYVLALSPNSNRLTLVSLGMMVLFTTLLALVSGIYALSSTLIAPESDWRWPISVVLGLLYAFGILIIDREIVGAASMKSMPIRLVFAIGIATAVSYPVKLKFFEGRLNNEISQMIEERNHDKLQRISELKLTGEPERQQQRAAVQGRIASIDKEVAVLDSQILREANDIRCDKRCQNFRRQKEELLQQRVVAERSLQDLAARPALAPHLQREVDQLEGGIKAERDVSYDFLTKWEALGRIKAGPKIDYEVLSWFVFGFFLLLELVPLALKWSLGKTEYNYYIEARTNLNKQKIIAFNNIFMEAMQRDPMLALEILPLEITDLIAAHMEDEALGSVNAPSLNDLLSALRRRGAAPTVGETAQPLVNPEQAASPSTGPSTPSSGAQTVDEPPPPIAR